MAQADELVVQHGVFTQTADGNAHAAIQVAIQSGLGPGGVVEVGQELLRAGGQSQSLRCGMAVGPAFQNGLQRGLFAERHADRRHMAVGAGHPQALGADSRFGRVDDLAVFQMAENFQRFLFALFILAADVGDHVIHHFRPALEGLACTADGLIGANHDLLGLKVQQGPQGGHVALDGAVGLDGDEAVFRAQTLPLSLDHRRVVAVDLGDQHGNVADAAVGAVVGYHRRFRTGVPFLQRADLVLLHIHGAEDEIHPGGHFLHLSSVQHGHIRHVSGDGAILERPAAFHCFPVRFSRAAGGRGQTGHLKPGVMFQQESEALADHSGRAHDTYTIRMHSE